MSCTTFASRLASSETFATSSGLMTSPRKLTRRFELSSLFSGTRTYRNIDFHCASHCDSLAAARIDSHCSRLAGMPMVLLPPDSRQRLGSESSLRRKYEFLTFVTFVESLRAHILYACPRPVSARLFLAEREREREGPTQKSHARAGATCCFWV